MPYSSDSDEESFRLLEPQEMAEIVSAFKVHTKTTKGRDFNCVVLSGKSEVKTFLGTLETNKSSFPDNTRVQFVARKFASWAGPEDAKHWIAGDVWVHNKELVFYILDGSKLDMDNEFADLVEKTSPHADITTSAFMMQYDSENCGFFSFHHATVFGKTEDLHQQLAALVVLQDNTQVGSKRKSLDNLLPLRLGSLFKLSEDRNRGTDNRMYLLSNGKSLAKHLAYLKFIPRTISDLLLSRPMQDESYAVAKWRKKVNSLVMLHSSKVTDRTGSSYLNTLASRASSPNEQKDKNTTMVKNSEIATSTVAAPEKPKQILPAQASEQSSFANAAGMARAAKNPPQNRESKSEANNLFTIQKEEITNETVVPRLDHNSRPKLRPKLKPKHSNSYFALRLLEAVAMVGGISLIIAGLVTSLGMGAVVAGAVVCSAVLLVELGMFIKNRKTVSQAAHNEHHDFRHSDR